MGWKGGFLGLLMKELEGFSLPLFTCISQFPLLLVRSWDGKLFSSAGGTQGTRSSLSTKNCFCMQYWAKYVS